MARQAKRNYQFHLTQEELEDVVIHSPLSQKQEAFMQDNESDIIVFGGAKGSGKSQMTLLKMFNAGMFDKDYSAVITMYSQKMIKGAGSLWSTGNKLFTRYGVRSNGLEMNWSFPSGAEIKCHHLLDNQQDFYGFQITHGFVDEAQFTKVDDVWHLITRMRSKSKRKHQLMLTCNPDRNSFLCDWLTRGGYLLESGLPNPDMDGQKVWMIQIGGEFQFFKDKKEITEQFGSEVAGFALRFVFYSANIYDNPWLLKNQPKYVHNLENQKRIDREKNLLGNWYVAEENSGYAKREMFKECPLSDVPLGLPTVRAWDLAATKPSEVNPDPDWTRGVKATYDKADGSFYIMGMDSIRDRSALVQDAIEKAAKQDGREVYVSIPVDSGSAGKTVADQKKARLMKLGHKVVLSSARQSKMKRAEPFLLALQEGKVHVVKGTFSEQDYAEIENFDGAKSNGYHDDIIDAIADAYTTLSSKSLVPTIRIPTDNLSNARRMTGTTLI